MSMPMSVLVNASTTLVFILTRIHENYDKVYYCISIVWSLELYIVIFLLAIATFHHATSRLTKLPPPVSTCCMWLMDFDPRCIPVFRFTSKKFHFSQILDFFFILTVSKLRGRSLVAHFRVLTENTVASYFDSRSQQSKRQSSANKVDMDMKWFCCSLRLGDKTLT